MNPWKIPRYGSPRTHVRGPSMLTDSPQEAGKRCQGGSIPPRRQFTCFLSGFCRRDKSKHYALLRSLAILVAAVILFFLQPKADYQDIRVSRVYDGDTVQLANGEKIRLIGIDCPEANENDKLFRDEKRTGVSRKRIMLMGRTASEFTRQLVLGKQVLVEFDIQKYDRYGRTLGYLWLKLDQPRGMPLPDFYVTESRKDSEGNDISYVFVNATILKAGYADTLSIAPNTRHADYFRELTREARLERRGIFGL